MTVGELTAEVRQSLATGEGRGSTLRLIRQFLMDLQRAEDPAELLHENPETTGDRRWDALIAGVVEDFTLHRCIEAPEWVFEPARFSTPWWFVTTIEAMRPTVIVETPAALANHGVFISRASLVNV
ncbi:MAG: hypothetical protein ACYCUF_02945 [Acidimicrobiales bacterium]|nr:hypothetical protein [Actinomycetota bacterium]